jgi:hypothetical protein
VFYTRLLGDNDFLRGHAYYFPTVIKLSQPVPKGKRRAKKATKDSTQVIAELEDSVWVANLSEKAHRYLAAIGADSQTSPIECSRRLWLHVLLDVGDTH